MESNEIRAIRRKKKGGEPLISKSHSRFESELESVEGVEMDQDPFCERKVRGVENGEEFVLDTF